MDCEHFKICGRPVDGDSDANYCILHSPNSAKEIPRFTLALLDHRDKRGNWFGNFVFPDTYYFRDLEFDRGFDTGSTGASFANFDRAIFLGDAQFRGAKFPVGATFDGVTFHKTADFQEASFGRIGDRFNYGVADFFGATFHGEARFHKAVWNNHANFNGSTFNSVANFSGTTCRGTMNFKTVLFNSVANFSGTNCLGCTSEASFPNLNFPEEVNFESARFDGPLSLEHSTFARHAKLRGAAICGRATFFGVKFQDGADFRDTSFGGEADFGSCLFNGKKTVFSPALRSETDRLFSGCKVSFREITIEPPDAMAFRDADFGCSRFLESDLRKVEFTGVRWSLIREGYAARYGVYDEAAPAENGRRPFSRIEQLYRQLSQNYMDRRDYERAGEFHYGEKEMRRQNPDTPLSLRIFLTAYWVLSGYGERYLRPLFWAAVLLIASTVAYLALGVPDTLSQQPLHTTSGLDWFKAALFSFRTMTLLKPEELKLNTWGAVIASTIQSIVGPVLVGLFALALRQRLAR